MKFCSVGAVKYKKERDGADAIQYLFDGTIQKPTDIQTFLNIIQDARSISTELNGSALTCCAMAGQLNSRLYLASINVYGSRGMENTSYPAGVTNGAAVSNMFYEFGCVKSNQQKTLSLTTTDYSFLDPDKVTLGDPDLRSPVAFSDKTNTYGYRLALYPSRLTSMASNLVTKMGFNLSAAQTLYSYTQNSYQYYVDPYTGWVTRYRTYRYTTYVAAMRFNPVDNKVYQAGSYSYSSIAAGNQTVNLNSVSIAGIGIIRSTQLYQYSDTGSGASSSSYQNNPQVSNVVTATQTIKAPYIDVAGTDELIDLSFSVIGYRDLEKDNIVIRDFTTDLTHAESTYPGNSPNVTLNTSITLGKLNPVMSL